MEPAVDVAALIPDAPAHDDATCWMGWYELVWGTASRLATLAADSLPAVSAVETMPDLGRTLGAFELLTLARPMALQTRAAGLTGPTARPGL